MRKMIPVSLIILLSFMILSQIQAQPVTGTSVTTAGIITQIDTGTRLLTIQTLDGRVLRVNTEAAAFLNQNSGLSGLRVGDRVDVTGPVSSEGLIRAQSISLINRGLASQNIPLQDRIKLNANPDYDTNQYGAGSRPLDLQDLSADRADAYLTGTIRSVSGSYPDYRITVRVRGNDYDVRTNRDTDFQGSQNYSARDLRTGDRISVQGALERNGRITAVSIYTGYTQTGNVSIITRIVTTPRMIEIQEPDGRLTTVLVRDYTEIIRGGERLDFEDLRVGDRVVLNLITDTRGRLAADRIEIVSDRGLRYVVGEITQIDTRAQLLWVNTDRGRIRVDAYQAEVIRNGRTVRFSDLREGDNVRISGDLTGTTVKADRIEVISSAERGSFSTEGTVRDIEDRTRSFTLQTRFIIPVRMRVNVSSSTVFTRNSRSASFRDLRTGDRVSVEGDLKGISQIDATRVDIR